MRKPKVRICLNSQTWRIILVVGLVLIAVAVLYFVLVDEWSRSSTFQRWANIVQSTVTALAIIFGGIFALFMLQAFRDFDPHLTVSHRVSHRLIGNSYMHVEVVATLHNSSRVKVDIRKGLFLLQKLSPISDTEVEALYVRAFEGAEYEEVQWPTLFKISRDWSKGELIIEPGESHPEILEFIVAKDVKSVMIYTYFHSPTFSEGGQMAQGWVATTVYDMPDIDRLVT